MNKTILATGAILGLLAVTLGAFGAHGLGRVVDADAVQTFETGVRYQMYHALFLLFLGFFSKLKSRARHIIFYLVLAGTILFCFSIYALATNELTSFDFKKIGFVTPIGGTLLLFGWVLLAYHILTKIKSD
ncbi:MAG: DUF423 domain-containing protein [Bacteroidota bacterium]